LSFMLPCHARRLSTACALRRLPLLAARSAAHRSTTGAAKNSSDPPPASGEAPRAGAPPPPPDGRADAPAGSEAQRGLMLQSHEEDNLPPLAFEPGVAGAAQKGISAIVIAFGAAALGACAWGASQALFPSATSTQSIYNEALEKVKTNADIAYLLGSPLRAFGADHGGGRGRRNAMERWDTTAAGSDVIVVRFHVGGPQGSGAVQVQVPANRRRGEFNYIIFEHPQSRRMIHVLDTRQELTAAIAQKKVETAGAS